MRAMNMNQQVSVSAAPTALCTTDGPLLTQSGFQGHGQQGSVNAAAGTGLCLTDGTAVLGGYAGGGYGQQGSGNADCLLLSTLADGSLVLNADAAAGLIYMIQEEKMARDLYDAFADQTGSVVFDRIAVSEQKHMDSLLLVAQKAGIDVSSVSTTVGVFTNTAIQGLYNTLLAQGSVSLDAAYDVGVLVEQTDIADLAHYTADSTIGIVGTVYANLENGSDHHLAAFTQLAALI